MDRLNNVRTNNETGENEYFFPMELTEETEKDYGDFIKSNGYEIGLAKLGYRVFKAVFIPVSKREYKELIKDELNKQDKLRQDNRCLIPGANGNLRCCPRRISNPEYIEGGTKPKTIPVKCENCIYKSFNQMQLSRTESLDSMLQRFEDGVHSNMLYQILSEDKIDDERLIKEWIKFVSKRKDNLKNVAVLLGMGYSQKEISESLNIPKTTLSSQTAILKKLCLEFLDTLI